MSSLIKVLCFFFGVVLLFSSCEKDPAITTTNTNTNAILPYMPHVVGSQWLYIGTSTNLLTNVTVPDTVIYSCTTTYTDFLDSQLYFHFDVTPYRWYEFPQHGLRMENGDYIYDNPWYNVVYLKEHMNVGDTWNQNFGSSGRVKYSVLNLNATVTVPAGTFDEVTVIKYEEDQYPYHSSDPAYHYISQQYYKRGIGLIKVVTNSRTSDQSMQKVSTVELSTYNIP